MEIDNLEKILAGREIKRKQMNKIQRNNYFKALRSTAQTPTIRAFCCGCIGMAGPEEIVDCRGFSCPMYFVRPEQYKDTREVRKIVLSKEPREKWRMPAGYRFKKR
jgi:hypothetical protein